MTKQRAKGVTFERYIANQLKPMFPRAMRGLQFRSGEENCDVIGTPWWIECKCYHTKNVYPKKWGRWYDKAYNDMVAARESDLVEDMDVIVVVKLTHSGPKKSIFVFAEALVLAELGIEGDHELYVNKKDWGGLYTKRGVKLVKITWDKFYNAVKEL